MNISEFERQKQYRIDIIKSLIKHSDIWELASYHERDWLESELSCLVKKILVEIDKV